MKKIGIFGGLFDPPHIGHLLTALDALTELSLDEIWFLVSFNPPHRNENASFDDRLKMVELSIKNFDKFKAMDLEKKLNLEKSFSLIVIKEIKKIYKENEFWFLIGSDQFERFSTWYKPEEILKEIKIAVLKRKTEDLTHLPFSKEVVFLNNRCIEISSSEIRKRIKEGKEIKFFVRDEVEKYIKEKEIYK